MGLRRLAAAKTVSLYQGANIQFGAPGVFVQRLRRALHFSIFRGKHFSSGRVPATSLIACRIRARPLSAPPPTDPPLVPSTAPSPRRHLAKGTCTRVAWAWWDLGVVQGL